MLSRLVIIINYLRFRWSFYKTDGRFYIMRFPAIRGAGLISLGEKFGANRFLRLEAIGKKGEVKIKIGDFVSMGESVHIGAINLVEIHDHVLMGSRILITDHNHGSYDDNYSSSPNEPPQTREIISKGKVIIEKNVWIGDGVIILPNVTIGEGSIIAANSVISKNVPPNCIVAGNPQKIIKQYNFQRNIWENSSKIH